MTFTKETRYSYYPTYRVAFKDGGEGTLAVTSATHISFDANHHCINGAPGDRCWIVYRGKEYGAHLHFNIVDGEWTLGEHPFVTLVSTSKNGSPTALKWIENVMREIVVSFVESHPEVLKTAERERIERLLDATRESLKETAQKAASLENQIIALESEFASL